MKVAAIQCKIGDLRSAENVAKNAVEESAEIILFPEYFSYINVNEEESERTLDFLKNFSKEYDTVAIGNAVVEDGGFRNRAFIYESGEVLGFQDKIHPTESERVLGIKAGEKLKVFELKNVKLCILICADILYPEICRVAGIKGVDITFNPVISLKHSELPGRNYRYCLYFTRAFENGYAIVKAGGFGRTFTGNIAAGRSLIATFDGIVAKAKNEEGEEALIADLDIDMIRCAKKKIYSLFNRNIKAYEELLI